jgi:hypothetical protein
VHFWLDANRWVRVGRAWKWVGWGGWVDRSTFRNQDVGRSFGIRFVYPTRDDEAVTDGAPGW